MMRQRRGARQPGLPLMLLLMQMFNVGFDRIPPVTLATIAGQVIIFLRLVNLPWPHISEVCISPIHVWYREEWQRLILASFFHLSDWHLYYNMVSFLWKGISLERKLGSKYFAYLIAVFSVLTSAVTVGLGIAADNILHDSSYLSQCAAGFSGVLFALKVITTHLLPPGVQYIMGFIPVPSRIACWVELAVIQLLVPNASFLGHLAGILVGLMYVKGPLKYVMDFAFPTPPSYTYAHGTASRGTGRTTGQTTGRTTTNRSYGWFGGSDQQTQPPRQDSGYYSGSGAGYSHNGYQYHGGLSEEEQIQKAMQESMQDFTDQGTQERVQPSAPPSDVPTGPPPAYDTLDHTYTRRSPAPYPTVPPGFTTETPYQNQEPPYPTPSGQGAGLYPDLSREVNDEEMRRRRLARFDSR